MNTKFFWKIILSVTALCGAIAFCLYIGEKYFFDKLIYRKSETFGYHPGSFNLLATKNSKTLEDRLKDLRFLYTDEDKNNNVLGSQYDSRFKIAIIGDSFVYGLGVKIDQRFANLLENKLNKIKPTKVYIIAQDGDDMLENYEKFLLARERYKPNLYIIGVLYNDFILTSGYKYSNGEILHKKLQQTCPGKEFYYDWPERELTVSELIAEAFYPSTLPEYANMCYFNEIVRDMTTENVLFYSYHKEAEKYRESQRSEDQMIAFIIQKYTDIIRQNKGRIIFFDESGFTPVSVRETHPSTDTHEAYAQQLFEEIKNSNVYGLTL